MAAICGGCCAAQRLEMTAAFDVFRKVCSGVAHAHERGPAHRDSKPANILIGKDGTVKVALRPGKTLVDSVVGYGFTQTRDTFGTAVLRRAGGHTRCGRSGCALRRVCTRRAPRRVAHRRGADGAVHAALGESTASTVALTGIVSRALADDPTRRLGSVAELGCGSGRNRGGHKRGH